MYMNYFHDVKTMIFRTINKLNTWCSGFEQTVNCHILKKKNRHRPLSFVLIVFTSFFICIPFILCFQCVFDLYFFLYFWIIFLRVASALRGLLKNRYWFCVFSKCKKWKTRKIGNYWKDARWSCASFELFIFEKGWTDDPFLSKYWK